MIRLLLWKEQIAVGLVVIFRAHRCLAGEARRYIDAYLARLAIVLMRNVDAAADIVGAIAAIDKLIDLGRESLLVAGIGRAIVTYR